MSQFYTPEYIDENYPEHCRTSCSDEHPINAEVNGHGCLRCNALLFQKQEAEHEEITRLRAELAKVTWQRNEAQAGLAASQAECERLRDALEKIADWNGCYGPFPESNNELWRGMAIVTAREAAPNPNAIAGKGGKA